jgi:phospholipase A1
MPENLLILLVMLFIATASYADNTSEDDAMLAVMGPSEETLPDDEDLPAAIYQYPGLAEKVKTERFAAQNPYLLLPHKPNYFMPLTYQTKINQEEQEEFYKGLRTEDEANGNKTKGFENTEFVFQVSVKYMVAKDILGKFSTLSVAYTGKSFWQAYNKDISALFRETNHEPEIILGFNPKFNWSDHMAVAFNHQSNGQIGNLSRSWNRIIVSTAKIWPDRILNVRAWYRIPEEKKETPSAVLGDDNPDILKYMGYGDVFYSRKLGDYSLGITVRNNLRASDNLGSIELDWNFPLPGGMKGFIQYFNGYGESLIDYDQYQERIGVGIKISDWL